MRYLLAVLLLAACGDVDGNGVDMRPDFSGYDFAPVKYDLTLTPRDFSGLDFAVPPDMSVVTPDDMTPTMDLTPDVDLSTLIDMTTVPDMTPCGGAQEACCPNEVCTNAPGSSTNRCMRRTSDGALRCVDWCSGGSVGGQCCTISGGTTTSVQGFCGKDPTPMPGQDGWLRCLTVCK